VLASYLHRQRKGEGVSKLFSLKEWLSLADAAKRLSTSFGEEVTEADIIQLALEGRLRLSLQILGYVYAHRAYKKLESEVEYEEIEYTLPPELDPSQETRIRREPIDGEVLRIPEFCGDGEVLQLGTSAICFARDYPDRQIVDFPVTWFSRPFLLQYFDHLRLPLEEPVECATDRLLIQEKSGDIWHIESYDNFLPGDVEVVVRTQALRDLEQSFEDVSANKQDKPLSTRERDTLYKIIIGMAMRGYGHDPSAQRSSAIADIARDLEEVGLPVSDDTIRKYMKEAAALLDSKSA